jgi:tryptophan halogenase
MPFIMPYEPDEKFVPETTATALSAGWMWTIPLQSRKGCGYVFDSRYITRDDAKKEVEQFLGKEIDPIKWIEFDSGYSKEFWKNNVLCLGLASSFVEPLEATSIHNTIVQLAIFVKQFLKKDKNKTVTLLNQKIYNQRVRFLNKLTIDFISLHYKGQRNDTDFWKNINNKKLSEEAQDVLSISKDKIPNFVLLEGMYGSWSIPLLNWIFAGINVISPDVAANELKSSSINIADIEKLYINFVESIIKNKSYIIKA